MFFMHLHEGRYADAVALYGGSYDPLRDWNESVEPDDFTTLMRNACKYNGIQCLPPHSIAIIGADASGDIRFNVQFMNDDGALFVGGPCCGANATGQPPESTFTYTVARNASDKLLVMEMPPYVP